MFDVIVELLNVGGGETDKLFLTEKAFDLIVDHLAVSVVGAFLNCEYHVLVQPLVEPFAERHSAFFRQVHVAVQVDEQVELFECGFLCFAEHRFEYRRAVFLMPDDDSTFPSSVRAFGMDGRRSIFCHCISSFIFLQRQHTTGSRIYPAFLG